MTRFCEKSVFVVALATLAVLAGMPGVARADGLIANWTLNDAGPGHTITTGATIADASGNGHAATLLGCRHADEHRRADRHGPDVQRPQRHGQLPQRALFRQLRRHGLPDDSARGSITQAAPTTPMPSSIQIKQSFNLWNQNGGNQSYKWGYYLPEPNDRMGSCTSLASWRPHEVGIVLEGIQRQRARLHVRPMGAVDNGLQWGCRTTG